MPERDKDTVKHLLFAPPFDVRYNEYQRSGCLTTLHQCYLSKRFTFSHYVCDHDIVFVIIITIVQHNKKIHLMMHW